MKSQIVLSLLVAFGVIDSSSEANNPNIVFIIADDMVSYSFIILVISSEQTLFFFKSK